MNHPNLNNIPLPPNIISNHNPFSSSVTPRTQSIGHKMDINSDQISVKSYNEIPSSFPLPPSPPPRHRRRAVVAKGMQKTLSKTSMLINFLPTGTLLTFEILLPSISGDGSCSRVTTIMILALLALCSLSCFFFHFTDSFRGFDDKIYYGFVTPRGLAVFQPGLGVEVPKDERFKLGLSDLVHAGMSVMVFMAVAFSDIRVTNCLFPGHKKEMDEVMESFPLMVGVVWSGLFLVFPNTRFGIGCMAA